MFLNSFQLQSCKHDDDGKTKHDDFSQIKVQSIDYSDSLFILYTVKELGNLNWWTFEDYAKMYKLENKDVKYFIGRVFYDPEKLKMIVWYGTKVYNAPTLESYSDDPQKNRICPTGGDTIYSMSALIGFRDSLHQVWNLYPFDNQSVSCSPKNERVLNIMEQYYFDKMKGHSMWRIIQDGTKKGELELKAYGYNIQDDGFWKKCWLWEKDMIGSNGLYPFQVKSYSSIKGQECNKCAELFDVPKINYPLEILNLYK
jgi:hypothetical protein